MSRTEFTTTTRGLDRASLPMRLYEKAKRLGTWNPSDIDLTRDAQDWEKLNDEERDSLVQLTALFQAGEEGVTIDLLPLIHAIADEGRIEEELFLTTFLFEEGKHVDFFRRVLDEVCRADGDLTRYHREHYRRLFYEELPAAMGALLEDRSAEAQLRAAVTYNMIIEGVLAETGYHSYFDAIERSGLMPGVREGVTLVKRDESRHIAYGLHLISRLVADRPDLWPAAQARMAELLEPALGVVQETFVYDPMPFGIELDSYLEYAAGQFSRRMERLERAAREALPTDDEEV